MTVADSVFPAQEESYTDSGGKSRKVGQEEYKNRLMAYLDSSLLSNSSASILESQLSHLAARLDAIYEKMCKGVHTDINEAEARIAIIHTYMFLAEIARVAETDQVYHEENSA